LEAGRDVRVETYVNGTGMLFPESRVLSKLVSTCPRSSQVVNGGHIGRCCNYYQFIMKAEGMKNHGVRITYALQPLSPVPYTQGCVMENLQFDSKHLVTMNSVFFGTILPSARSVINPRGSTPILFTKSDSGSVCKFSRRPRSIEFSILGIRPIYCAQDRYRSCHGDLSEHEEGYT
jgi:hypothetical protein